MPRPAPEGAPLYAPVLGLVALLRPLLHAVVEVPLSLVVT